MISQHHLEFQALHVPDVSRHPERVWVGDNFVESVPAMVHFYGQWRHGTSIRLPICFFFVSPLNHLTVTLKSRMNHPQTGQATSCSGAFAAAAFALPSRAGTTKGTESGAFLGPTNRFRKEKEPTIHSTLIWYAMICVYDEWCCTDNVTITEHNYSLDWCV